MPPSSSSPIEVVCALIERDGCVLMAQRPAHKHLGGKWEFPGGKVEAGESPVVALHRELLEELGCCVEVLRLLQPQSHDYGTVKVHLIPFVVRLLPGSDAPQALEHTALSWVPAGELAGLDLPAADLPIIADYLHPAADSAAT